MVTPLVATGASVGPPTPINCDGLEGLVTEIVLALALIGGLLLIFGALIGYSLAERLLASRERQIAIRRRELHLARSAPQWINRI